MRLAAMTTVLMALLAGCGRSEPEARKAPASERERDSALAGSRLPGARGVGGALRLSDSAAARRAREDSISADR